MNVKNTGRLLFIAHNLNIWESTMVKNSMNVKNVGRPLIMAQDLFYIFL